MRVVFVLGRALLRGTVYACLRSLWPTIGGGMGLGVLRVFVL